MSDVSLNSEALAAFAATLKPGLARRPSSRRGTGVTLPSFDPWPGDPSVWDGVAARHADRTYVQQVRKLTLTAVVTGGAASVGRIALHDDPTEDAHGTAAAS